MKMGRKRPRTLQTTSSLELTGESSTESNKLDIILKKIEDLTLKIKVLEEEIAYLRQEVSKKDEQIELASIEVKKLKVNNEFLFKNKIKNDVVFYGIKDQNSKKDFINLINKFSKDSPISESEILKIIKINPKNKKPEDLCPFVVCLKTKEFKKYLKDLFNKKQRELNIRVSDRLTINEVIKKKELMPYFLNLKKQHKNVYFVRDSVFVNGNKINENAENNSRK